MKIVYILKKGLICYPPCFAQVLYLNDLGVDVEVYHGKESDAVLDILEKRGIKHHILKSDKENVNKIQRATTLLRYTKEIVKILKSVPKDVVIWFGNCESALTVGRFLKERKVVLSILELYDKETIYGKFLTKYINYAHAVLCCEKHRAEIMKVWYKMDKTPYVIPNKPYDNIGQLNEGSLTKEIQEKIKCFSKKKVLLYQGIISQDRPLDIFAKAVSEIGDDDLLFVVMGKATNEMKQQIQSICKNVEFVGYVPSPQHLLISKYAKIGVANYDYSVLNNVFCAPNKIYEYSKFGIPMIVSKNLSLVETVGYSGAGECVDFNDVAQIKAGIIKILNNYNTYSKNAKNFYAETDNFKGIKDILEDINA